MNFLVSWPCKVLQGGSQDSVLHPTLSQKQLGCREKIDMYTIDCRIPNRCPLFLDHGIEVATEMEIGYLHDVFPKLCGEQATGFREGEPKES